MKNILLTGARDVGTDKVAQELEKKIPYSEKLVSENRRKYYMRHENLFEDELTSEKRRDLELKTMAGSIGSLIQAKNAQVRAVLDGSLIESYVYSEDVLDEYTREHIEEYLRGYNEHSVAYVIPPINHIEGTKDMLEERVNVHRKIMQVIDAFGIPYEIITSVSPEDRADEILHYHTNKYEKNT